MAIELGKEKRTGAPLWTIFLFIGVALAIALLAASYIYFFVSQKSAAKKIADLDASSADLNIKISQKESELSFAQAKIDDYNKIINSHKNLSNTFVFIEKNIIAPVWFNSFDFSNVDRNSVTLGGVGPNFIAIGQQIEAFKKQDLVKEIYLSDISINKEGEIVFLLKIFFTPEVFSFEKEI